MAAVEVTISGMLYDKLNRTTQNVVLIGEATLTGLGVGGGPMPPGPGGGPGYRPEHPIYWPPGTQPHPEHPIYYPPGSLPHPEHPIVLPKPPIDPPPTDPPTQPPSDNWVWGWVPMGQGQGRWSPVYVPEAGVDPGPKT